MRSWHRAGRPPLGRTLWRLGFLLLSGLAASLGFFGSEGIRQESSFAFNPKLVILFMVGDVAKGKGREKGR